MVVCSLVAPRQPFKWRSVRAVSELTDRLRTERSVLLVPGDHFDMDGYFRIGFGSDPKYLESALTLIGEFLRTAGAYAR